MFIKFHVFQKVLRKRLYYFPFSSTNEDTILSEEHPTSHFTRALVAALYWLPILIFYKHFFSSCLVFHEPDKKCVMHRGRIAIIDKSVLFLSVLLLLVLLVCFRGGLDLYFVEI